MLSGEAGWPRSDKGPSPADLSFHRQAARVSMREEAVMDVQSHRIAVRHCHLGTDAEREATGGYRPCIRDSCQLVAGHVWGGPEHFLTFPVGLRNSCLPLEDLEVHSWGSWRLCGRRTQGLHGRQWLHFGKLVMLDIWLIF